MGEQEEINDEEIERIRGSAGIRLDGVFAEVEFLPELAELWEETPESAQDAFDYYWSSEVMGDELRALEHWHRDGLLTTEQEERYAQLTVALEEALPIVEKLGLRPPQEIIEGG